MEQRNKQLPCLKTQQANFPVCAHTATHYAERRCKYQFLKFFVLIRRRN